MCGIVALINTKRNSVNIGSLLDSINHRGPDDRGWVSWVDGNYSNGRESVSLNGELILGHVRLSILDLSAAGWQPMISGCSRYSLTYNGEIYNYIELREELKKEGYTFRSESDTEVLLYSLIHWKEGALNKLRGMFGFVFYDSVSKDVLIARDFFGIKPVYWAYWDGGVAIGSEASSLLKLPGVGNDYSPQATYEYFLVGASDHGHDSIYKDLKFLPAAHYAKINLNDSNPVIQPIKYWSLDLTKKVSHTFEEAVENVRKLFLESVSLHLRSDVPVGTALSGGIDSSAIVGAVRMLNPDQEIHTFSFIADDDSISEEKWIDIVNESANCIPHKIYATKQDLVEDLDDLISTQGEPFGSTSIYAQYRVFKRVQEENIKVMLDGQGADEMLAGYVSYQGSRLATLIASGRFLTAYNFLKKSSSWPGRGEKLIIMLAARELLPNWVRWVARKLVSKGVPPVWISREWIKYNSVNTKPDLVKGVTGTDKMRSRLEETLTRSSIPHLLRYEDRNSMRFSIESRVPFLHVDLVEYLFSLPEEYLVSDSGCSKYVFREAMRGLIPDEILDRKDKVGFATPEKEWLFKMNDWVAELFDDSESMSCLDSKMLRGEWQSVMEGSSPFNFRCWRWLNFIAWNKRNAGEEA